ncbi:hypothetical protein [Paenibacillus nasutitermitis]|nr:hypothetical protein [Paenibacillus nasutitermitis]
MSENVNEQELVQYIAGETKADAAAIKLVLKHEQTFINNSKENAKGEVEVDSDELVDYVLSRPDIKLDELTVESILEAEMDFLMEKGVAGYED